MMESKLSENGIIIQNMYGWQGNVLHNMQQVFHQLYVLEATTSSKVVVGTKYSRRLSKEELVDRAILYRYFQN